MKLVRPAAPMCASLPMKKKRRVSALLGKKCKFSEKSCPLLPADLNFARRACAPVGDQFIWLAADVPNQNEAAAGIRPVCSLSFNDSKVKKMKNGGLRR